MTDLSKNGELISRVYLADCMEIMSQVPDKFFDLAIVDPLYGIGVDGKNLIKNNSDRFMKKAKRSHEWDNSVPDKLYFDELKRISKEQIIWGGNYFLDYLGYCKAPIIWNKKNGDSMYADGEMAWTSMGLPKNLRIWNHQWCGAFKDSERGVDYFHPTTKPIALYKWLLRNYAHPGDKIFDSHMGSQSSRIACYEGGFDFWGCELDQDYFEAGCKRFETYKLQLKLF